MSTTVSQVSNERRRLRRFLRHRLALFSLFVIALLSLNALLAPQIAPYDYTRPILTDLFLSPSGAHWFGTDDLGRDTLSRVVYGGRVSLIVGLLAAFGSTIFGTLIGVFSGYLGSWVDNLLMRLTDIMLSIPTLPILIVVGALLREKDTPLAIFFEQFGAAQNVLAIITIIVLFSWMNTARLVRADILSLKERDFTQAARALGASAGRIMFNHLIPNTLAIIIVQATLGVGRAIIIESGLSFLGFGIQSPDVSWGTMLSRAQQYFLIAPWLAFFPGLMIFLTVLSFNYVGDGLRDALDPRFQR
jgi:peptide/nickel transport system permease protein